MTQKITPIDMKTGEKVAEVLSPILLDLLELHTHVKTAHWNLRDKNFIAVHRLFDEVADLTDKSGDSVAERIRQLGAVVVASSSLFSKENRLPSFPSGELDAEKAITAVCHSMKKSIDGIRAGIDATSGTIDEPITTDLLTRIAGELEQYLWFLDSHR